MEINLLVFVIKIVIFNLINNVMSNITTKNNDDHHHYDYHNYSDNGKFLNTNINNDSIVKIIEPVPFKGNRSSINNDTISKSSNSNVFNLTQTISNNNNQSTITMIIDTKVNKHIYRIRRESSLFDEDELGWTNINEEVDMALKTIWPHFIENGYTTLKLPDINDKISVKPLLITYSAGLRLTNGHLYNIEGLQRIDDAYMTYIDKSFQFRLNIVIKSQQFVYDFIVSILGIEISGTANGLLKNTLVAGDFSVRATDANMKLNDFKIISFGNIKVSLTHNRIIRQLSSMILTPITRFFEDRITTTISDAIRIQLGNLMDDINKDDTLELKKFLNHTLSGIVG